MVWHKTWLGTGHGSDSKQLENKARSQEPEAEYACFEGGRCHYTSSSKRGFNARFAKNYQMLEWHIVLKIAQLGVEEFYKAGLIQNLTTPVKILARGEISQGLTIKAQAFSAQAAEKIVAAGGKAEVI